MASYLDQIPKQLAARRKAFRAARDNPALLPSCWAIVRSIATNMYDYARNAVIGGCTFPDRPVYLSVEDAAFLNFGMTPRLLLTDRAWFEAEQAKEPPPEGDAQPSPEGVAAVRKLLAAAVRVFGTDHRESRVYNLAPWLQDMYRDRLDVDYAEDLQRQIDALNAYMDSVPKSLAATGLNARLSKGVMDAFNLFKTITGSSHQLDREKMSFVDRRSYVNTVQKIELIMAKADESLGSRVAGHSVVRELFGLWKDANYEMMALTRQLRALWAGTSLDDRIQELANLLGAIQRTLNRCSEESATPSPQLPSVLTDGGTAASSLTRAAVEDAFHSIVFYDFVSAGNATGQVRELRKFGPLSVVIAPGTGQPRYCSEIRRLNAAEDEDARKRRVTDTAAKEREMDVDRRVRYPLNCLVVPMGTPADTFEPDVADAWLEYAQSAFPVGFKELMEAAKAAAPGAFLPPENRDAKDLPPTYARQALGRLAAAFARWAHTGEEPENAEGMGFGAFRDLALSRLKQDDFLLPLRFRPLLNLYAEAGPKRRMEMWKRFLGPRFALDRQLVAVTVLMKDWNSLRDHLRLLPLAVTQKNSSLANGFAKAGDKSDPFSGHKASELFRKFLLDVPDLKSALLTVESQVAIEVETLRTQSESLGKVFQYDQAAETMLRRQSSQIQERRLAANAHIDHYLIGLMYAIDGNLEAAEGALAMSLAPRREQPPDSEQPPSLPEEAGEEWFQECLRPLDGKFEKRMVPGENGPGTVFRQLVHYNLGLIYLKQERFVEARMSFRAVLDESPPDKSFLYKKWAAEHFDAAGEKMRVLKKADISP